MLLSALLPPCLLASLFATGSARSTRRGSVDLPFHEGSWAITNGTWPADPAYYRGRFSNGPVWPEFVAHHLQIGLRNYAVGGGACARHRRSTDAHSDLRQSARPRASKLTFADDLVQGHTGYGDLSIPAPSMLDQVGRYVDDEHRSNHPHQSVFALMIGANDIYFGRQVNADQVAEKLELAISRLRDAGAYAFVLGVPYSLALTPNGVASPDPAFDRFAADLRREVGKLRIRLSSRQYKLKVAILDVGAITSRVASDPERYGFDARLAERACLMGPYGGPRSLCDMPEPYMWWDEFHPTRRLHEEFARDAETIIKRRLTSLGWVWSGW